MPKESIWKESWPRPGQSVSWGTCKFLPCARLHRLVYACKLDSCLRSRFQRNCFRRAWSTEDCLLLCSHLCPLPGVKHSTVFGWIPLPTEDYSPVQMKQWQLERYDREKAAAKTTPRTQGTWPSSEVGKRCLCRLQQELLLAGLVGESRAQKGLPFCHSEKGCGVGGMRGFLGILAGLPISQPRPGTVVGGASLSG